MRIIFIIFLLASIIDAQIYVSVTGNDVLGDASIEKPIRTISKAFELSNTQIDTIYLRGGIYEESQTLEPLGSGSETNYKCLFAYPGELPIIDFSMQEYASSNRGFKLTQNYWHLKGLEIKNAGDNGIHISGNYNKVENCSLHHNKDTGLQISNGGAHNFIVNCDSYLNYDPNTNGENADGFAPKLDIGPGNYFKNCRAYLNSDDGWDCYEGQNQIIIDSCWAFQNGYNIWSDPSFQGDGNGFKLGGNYISAPHLIRNSIAFDNVSKGFDQNHNTAGITVLNCTAYRNDKNFSFSEDPTDSVHVLMNNISFDGSNSIGSSSLQESNSWNGFFATWQDFVSLDTSLAKIQRDEYFNIPLTNFLRLKSTSQFIDAGIDVGIPFIGEAPDLGAFEYDGITKVENELPNIIVELTLYQNYPNPFNPTTKISYSIAVKSNVTVKIYNSLGREISTLVDNKLQNSGKYEIYFDGSNLASGVYFVKLFSNSRSESMKMILVK